MTRRIRAFWSFGATLVAAALLLWPAHSLAAPVKRALVIGNSAYANVSPLTNPANDAADLTDVLRGLGFIVDHHQDLGQIELLRALQSFQRDAADAEVAIIYYAGHGIEVNRRNYLIPVDATLESDRDVDFQAVPLELALRAVEGADTLRVVILDACRDNPFLKQMTRSTRSIGRGLAAIEPEGNTLVAYAAKEGTVAQDGEARNSPYAAALIATLREPGVEIGKVFRLVRDRVIETTNGAQEPFLYGSLSAEDIYLNPPAAPESAPAPVAEATPVAPAPGHAVEIAFWNAIAGSSDPRDYQDYLTQYPNGSFASLASRRLEALSAPAARPEPAAEPSQVAMIGRAVEPEPKPEPAPQPYRPTMADVRDAQERLNALGYDAGPEDGSFGPRTARAIEAYQRARGEDADGSMSEALLAHLREDVTPAMLSDHRAAVARQAAARRTEKASVAPTKTAPEPAPAAPPADQTAGQPAAPQQAEAAAPAPAAPTSQTKTFFGFQGAVSEPDYSDSKWERRQRARQRESGQ